MLELGSSFCELARARTLAACDVVFGRLVCMEKWEAALKEHVKDTGREVADIAMANYLRRLVPTDL